MKKIPLFTLSLLSVFVSVSCYATQHVVLNANSLSDAQVSINDDIDKTQVKIINTNQDNVAHIYYDRFNINNDGLSLDNDKAELIINEVVSHENSELRGDLELQGKKATVIIANPNGISCYDCSFSGIDDIKLISGSSVGKFSKEFTITDNPVDFAFFNKLPRNEFTHINRHDKDISPAYINIISNNVALGEGDFNSKYIRFDIGLDKFNLNYSNDYNRKGDLVISDNATLNSRYLIIKGNKAAVSHYGHIDTLSLNANVNIWWNLNDSIIDLNRDINLYKTAYDDVKKSKLNISTYYFSADKSSFYVKDSALFINAKDMMLLNDYIIDNSYLISRVNYIDMNNITLKKSYFDVTSLHRINIDGKIHGEGSVVLEGMYGSFNEKDKIALTGKGLAGLKGQPKFQLGTSTVIHKGYKTSVYIN
ncbi:filamentous hemagglutinin N-terminal domain-containing protein [Proteus penneri]|uniref:Hemolysin n=1 Tax=Proteus penneri TaxID=102862 RepID=A0A0G4Q375_9GAMM|nr:filamentous hemagglutinin N-terminal domain-containing protein [Proteus penneri]CRL60303.1 Hemolysin precursor [Proteus penneri]